MLLEARHTLVRPVFFSLWNPNFYYNVHKIMGYDKALLGKGYLITSETVKSECGEVVK
jgi:hypothetical protein